MYGYFGNGDPGEPASRLTGRRLEKSDLRGALAGIEIDRYFTRLDRKTFIGILLS